MGTIEESFKEYEFMNKLFNSKSFIDTCNITEKINCLQVMNTTALVAQTATMMEATKPLLGLSDIIANMATTQQNILNSFRGIFNDSFSEMINAIQLQQQSLSEALKLSTNLGLNEIVNSISFSEVMQNNFAEQVKALVSVSQTINWEELIDTAEGVDADEFTEEEKDCISKEVTEKLNYIFEDNEGSTVIERACEVFQIQKESTVKKEIWDAVKGIVYGIISGLLATILWTCLSSQDDNKQLIVRNECNIEVPASYSIPTDTPIKILKVNEKWCQIQFEYNDEKVSGWILSDEIGERK